MTGARGQAIENLEGVSTRSVLRTSGSGRCRGRTILVLLIVAGRFLGQDAEQGKRPEATPPDLLSVLKATCVSCHRGERAKGGVDFDRIVAGDPAPTGLWSRAHQRVRDGSMPPEGARRLEIREREQLVQGLERAVAAEMPSRPVLRRLSRVQWARTVRAIFGVEISGERLPAESPAYGSDTVGDVMSVSPLYLEKLHDAAVEIAARTLTEPGARDVLFRPTSGKGPESKEEFDAVLTPLLRKAFRRPAQRDEVAARVEMAQAFGLETALVSVLLAPAFLLRVEEAFVDENATRTLTAHEAAVRLSYFLTSAPPDAELSLRADTGELQTDATLLAEARRLQASPAARGFAEDFGGAWLRHREARDKAADFRRFPDIWDQSLRDAMVEETTRFLEAIVREDRSVLGLLDARTTFVNERLAKHYELGGVSGSQFREVTWPDDRRGGLTGMASILFVTSFPLRTSPTLRGAWILDALLGDPPPPPPPNVGALPADDRDQKEQTLRQRLELHRQDAACASCHARMDPLGFALDHFDAMGRFRLDDEGRRINAEGILPDGTKITGAASLRTALLARSDDFVRNLSRRLFLTAVGRLPTPSDAPLIEQMVEAAFAGEFKFSTLLPPLLTSDAFLQLPP